MIHTKFIAWWVLLAVSSPLVIAPLFTGDEIHYLEGNPWDGVLSVNETYLTAGLVLLPVAAWYGSVSASSGLQYSESYSARSAWRTTLPWFIAGVAPAMIGHAAALTIVVAITKAPGATYIDLPACIAGVLATSTFVSLGMLAGRLLGQVFGPLSALACHIALLVVPATLGPAKQVQVTHLVLMPVGAFGVPNMRLSSDRIVAVTCVAVTSTLVCLGASAAWSRRGQLGSKLRIIHVVSTVTALAVSLQFLHSAPREVNRDPSVAECADQSSGNPVKFCVWPEHKQFIADFKPYWPTLQTLYNAAGVSAESFAEPGIRGDAIPVVATGYSTPYMRASSMLLPITGMGYDHCERATRQEIDWAFKWAMLQMIGSAAERTTAPSSELGGLDRMKGPEMEAWLAKRMPDIEWCAKNDSAYLNTLAGLR